MADAIKLSDVFISLKLDTSAYKSQIANIQRTLPNIKPMVKANNTAIIAGLRNEIALKRTAMRLDQQREKALQGFSRIANRVAIGGVLAGGLGLKNFLETTDPLARKLNGSLLKVKLSFWNLMANVGKQITIKWDLIGKLEKLNQFIKNITKADIGKFLDAAKMALFIAGFAKLVLMAKQIKDYFDMLTIKKLLAEIAGLKSANLLGTAVSGGIGSNIAGTAAGAAAGTAVGGPIIKSFGEFVKRLANEPKFKEQSMLQSFKNLSAVTSPKEKVIGGAGILLAGLTNSFKKIGTIFANFGSDIIVGLTSKFTTLITSIGGLIIALNRNTLGKLAPFFVLMNSKFTTLITSIGGLIIALNRNTLGKLGGIINKIPFASKIINKTTSIGSKVGTTITTGFAKNANIGAIGSTLLAITGVSLALRALGDGASSTEKTANGAAKVMKWFNDALIMTWNGIKWLGNGIVNIFSFVTKSVLSVFAVLGSVTDTIGGIIGGLISGFINLGTVLKNLGTILADIVTGKFKNIKSDVEILWQSMKQGTTGIVDAFDFKRIGKELMYDLRYIWAETYKNQKFVMPKQIYPNIPNYLKAVNANKQDLFTKQQFNVDTGEFNDLNKMFQKMFEENVNNNLIAAQEDNTDAVKKLTETIQIWGKTVSTGVQFNEKTGQLNSVFSGSSMINSFLNNSR